MKVGSSHEIPIILNLNLSPRTYSQHCFIGMNSDPKDDDSTEFCFLLHHYIGAQFKYTKNPVLEHLVMVSEA